jgi:hypothetical protein
MTRTSDVQVSVEGGVQSASAPDISVAGVPVHTDAQTTYTDRCDYDRLATEVFDFLTSSLQTVDPQATPPLLHVYGGWVAPSLHASNIELWNMPIRPTDVDCAE